MTPNVAIVTGASRGIGLACARALATVGFRIFLVAEGTAQELADAATECTKLHPTEATSHHAVFDLADPASAEAVAAAAMAQFGRIDFLLNNAGIRIRKPFGEFTADDFDRVVAINLRAPLLLSQAVLPAMRHQGGGRIVHIASELGIVADRTGTIYGLTKAALIHLTKSMAFELSGDNILVNAVSPGPIGTEYLKARLAREPEAAATLIGGVPAGRLGTPEEIAAAVVFLATTEATYLQGHNLVVDGGYVIH